MEEFLLFVAVGFAAQLIDGAIGMGHGLIGITILLSFGLPPATASASVHAAEVFTTAASGVSHWAFGNVDRALALRLAICGVIGGIIGAYVLVHAPHEPILIVVSVYLFLIGGVILLKAFRGQRGGSPALHHTAALDFSGGFLDAMGGGGWGPIVTSTLIGRGMVPRLAIGSSIAAEFFAAAVSATFIATIGIELWPVILGLIIGDLVAAPFSAYATRYLPDRPLMILVAISIMILSCRQVVLLVVRE